MFDLEKFITEWRQQMLAAGIHPTALEELDSHLREEIERQIQMIGNEQRAFELAAERVGHVTPLTAEFKKIETGNWNRPFAWVAWSMFVLSFFLPAMKGGWGWQCAGLSASVMVDFWRGNWMDIHLASLTLANLLMIFSPFLLWRWSRSPRSLRWLRLSFFAALVLVWSFILNLIAHEDGNELMVGCYVWGFSFLPLCLSTVKISKTHRTPLQHA
ncbi:MAG TPA: hypothetical protein VGN23_00905 [Verrucomicrobiae bacterium]|jgi:hypothetical protein